MPPHLIPRPPSLASSRPLPHHALSPPPQQHIANRRRTTLEVSLDDLEQYSKDPELVTRLERNTQQYLTLLAEAADNRMPAPCEDDLPEDVFDVLLDQVGLRDMRAARHVGRCPSVQRPM